MAEAVLERAVATPPRALRFTSDGRRRWVVALTDLDGTVNDETLAEPLRLGTIGPARDALALLERAGIAVGVITGRSFGEAALYHEALGITGPILCEDGAVLGFPPAMSHLLAPRDAYRARDEGWLRVLSEAQRPQIAAFLSRFGETHPEHAQDLLSSLSPRLDDLQRALGHPSRAATLRAIDRVASVLVCTSSTEAEQRLRSEAPQHGLRAFGRPLHLIGRDAHKGSALRQLDTWAREEALFRQPVDGIRPIVFGNAENDLTLFDEVAALGGTSVLVGHPSGGYFVPESHIPPHVIRAGAPFGHGIGAALAAVSAQLSGEAAR